MENLLNKDFWQAFYDKAASWVVTEVPAIIILIIVLIIAMRITRALIGRTKKIIIKRSEDEEGHADLETEKRINTLMSIVHGVLKIILWAIFIMIFLKKIGMDIGPIIASAGIIGLAVGFGAQELVRDFISGFFMLLENQVRTGDVAIINGTGGLVEKIEMRTITLRDLSGVVHVFQNGKINTLSNMTKEWSAMVFDVGVAYKEDVETVIGVIKDVGEELRNDPDFTAKILEPIEVFGLDQFGDSAIVVKARIKTKPGDQWTVGREFRKRLKKVFDGKNIEIPFPHVSLYWGEEIKPLKVSSGK
ncbi:MAG TPA: mechanosensitive ion channel family protein [Bacteroidales bacterium]|nr:mechanosensitive ion channel family protein [Bacteroidales bacterium]